jgi:uncharacterized membrane protein YfcA
MSLSEFALLSVVFFATSVVSVITGATSLVTVPVLLSMGIEPRIALATNMLALTFLSTGAAVPFLVGGEVERRGLPLLLTLTVAGSLAGALLVFAVSENFIRLIVCIAMLSVGMTVLRQTRDTEIIRTGRARRLTGYVVTLLLAVYGGFFSGGYVTMLTAAWTTLFGMSFRHAVATTKIANLISSLTAVVIFAARDAIDWQLGAILSAAAFLGALVGARWTLLLSDVWLRRVFVAVVFILALKTLVFDVRWSAIL